VAYRKAKNGTHSDDFDVAGGLPWKKGFIFKLINDPLCQRFGDTAAAFGLRHSGSEMGYLLRRMKARLGKAEGITATAHNLARVVYGMIKVQKSYDEKEAFKPNA